ncbi:hypothetical protein Patl1_15130 [Pistacia atlantica]|uniref:Uncharacterized protein n=1 Tax=Pistacia atlantica TaxID=434234 RepID=A0ACC1BBG6_9ROSI|nr:hypothetical protein Patl1_15130 [Pistacia atlantica]
METRKLSSSLQLWDSGASSGTQTPSMSMVLQMLEGEFKSLEIPPKPFVSSDEEMDGN